MSLTTFISDALEKALLSFLKNNETKIYPPNPFQGKQPPLRPVIVCTVHRGVFYGWANDTSDSRCILRRARMAIQFGTTRGVMELAETGPTPQSRISARADVDVRDVSAVFEVTKAAADGWEAWQDAPASTTPT